MDIKEIDLRRSDFEAMHPVAKLFNFDHEKLTYFGDVYDDAKRLNDLWSTWCACVGLLYLETNTAKAQAVQEGYVLVPMVPSERMINAVRQCYEGEAYLPYSLCSEFVNQAIIERMEAQEPSHD